MSITGNLRTLEFAELLQWLAQGQKTGALVVESGQARKRIFFKGGRIISSESNNSAEHLGTFMVREGLLDEETLARALKLQESTQILLGKVLVTLGTISEDELTRILKRKTEESLFELFSWTEGEFNFVPDDLPRLPMVPLEIDVTNVLLEGAKRFDEARRDGKIGNGDYGQEIEEMLSSEIFQGVDLDAGETDAAAGPAASHEQVAESTSDQEEASSNQAYYSGAAKTGGAKPMLAAAAAIAAIAIGIGSYFFLRPDPAGGTADRAGLESSIPASPMTVAENFHLPPEPNTSQQDPLILTEDSGAAVEESAAPDESEQMQARYEAELDDLKRQLRQARLAEAQRDDAIDKIAELEQQAAQSQEATTKPEPVAQTRNQFATAQFGGLLNGATLSAGGDEAPPLGSPLPATEADQEAGTDFATEMVEPGPAPPIPEANESSLLAVEEPVEEPVVEEPAPLIKAPVLLSRPKPRYPAAAMRMGKEAEVVLRLLIGANGKVVDVERLGKDPGMGFGKAAINAALATKWEPATRDDEPIEMWAEMRIAFKP
jgi:TonB family protein